MGKKSAPPPAPDLVGAAKETAAGNAALVEQQTQANRPNQSTAWGNTNWTKDPTSGQWTQTQTLNPAEQALLDKQRQISGGLADTATGLLGRAQESSGKPLDFSGLPQGQMPDMSKLTQMTGYDPSKLPGFGSINTGQLPAMTGFDQSKLQKMTGYDTSKLSKVDPNAIKQGLGNLGQTNWSGLNKLSPGFGSVEKVSEAMMGRMAPARAQQRASELQRLQNQGLNENSEAYQRALRRLDMGDTDANQQALLGGMQAYGDIFNRGLAANQQEISRQFGQAGLDSANRGQQFGENTTLQQMLSQLRGQQFGEQGAINNLNMLQNQQGFNQQGAMSQLTNAQRQQLFGEQSTMAGLADSQRGQAFGEQGAMGQMGMAQNQQQYNQMMQQAQLAGQLRQQGIAEQQMQRNDPYNQLMMLQGQAPTNPQMPSFMGAGVAQGPDILGATNAQYQGQLGAYNAQQAKSGGLMGGLMGMAGSALGGPMGGMLGSAIGKQFG